MDQRGLQQRDLAIGTGISTSSLSRKLACRQDIQLSELKAIAAFLNVTPECLLRGAA